MIHPVPTLDHVVINCRDRIDDAADTFRRLGFTLTPRGYHTLGSMNHLAMFGTEYLELIAARPGDTKRPEILASPEGLNGLVFGSEDAATTHAAMEQAGVPVFPWEQFSRPVTVSDGTFDATFRTVRLKPEAAPAGRVYFCHHLTRNLVWRDEWRHHANGVTGVIRAFIAARRPDLIADGFAQMFGRDALYDIPGGKALVVGLSRFDIITPEALASEFGDAAADGLGRDSWMAGLEFRTRSLETAAAALRPGQVSGVRWEADRIVIPRDLGLWRDIGVSRLSR